MTFWSSDSYDDLVTAVLWRSNFPIDEIYAWKFMCVFCLNNAVQSLEDCTLRLVAIYTLWNRIIPPLPTSIYFHVLIWLHGTSTAQAVKSIGPEL